MITKEEVEAKFPGAMDNVKSILASIGDNPTREGLIDTPFRVVKSWIELYAGYNHDISTVLSTFFQEGLGEGELADEIVMCKNIDFTSICEHHMLPFSGVCHIGYLPNGKVLGLSKMARLVDIFASRLQIQEKMTVDIAETMDMYLKPDGVGVIMEAQHFCMICRGVKKQNASMITSAMKGKFKNQPQTRTEFLSLIKD
jgi:GTP cyclohydrolase I